jgi:hypothetical protein
MPDTAVFVLCIENNAIRGQALMLIDSIRTFGGRHADAEIVAVAPRPGLGVDKTTRDKLDALGAAYHEAPLNTACPDYGSANRVYAAAWAAETLTADTLVVLDSDTLFLAEPELLDDETDVLVRPVDVKGSATTGPGDDFEPYWQALCDLAGVPVDTLPFIDTTFDRARIRASYNGGYAVVRRDTGILQRNAALFTRSVTADLRPHKGRENHRMFASTGWVCDTAAAYWGSNQATFAIAAWSTTRRVRILDRRYNVAIHNLADPRYWSDDWAGIAPVHIHYHWMLEPDRRAETLALLARLGVRAEQRDGIAAHCG